MWTEHGQEFRLFGPLVHLLSGNWVADKDHSLQMLMKLQFLLFSYLEKLDLPRVQALFGDDDRATVKFKT